MTVMKKNGNAAMKNGSAAERAVALVNEVLDAIRRAEGAPDSPMNELHPANVRRDYRRIASRLRKGKLEPRYQNLHTPEELADILERTARRDEMVEQGLEDFKRLSLKLDRVLQEDVPGVISAIRALAREAERAAEQAGPDSEAARRHQRFQFLGWYGQQWHSRHRHEASPAPRPMPPLSMDPSVEARFEAAAAEILDAPPPGEAVMTIPPDGRDFGRGRVLMRIGVGEASWVGSFACGHTRASTVLMMPGDQHLFVVAAGAGYVIDRKSRTLVGRAGLDVARVLSDESWTLFVVVHDSVSLEAFGTGGCYLWRTNPIGCGIRKVSVTRHRIVGEAWQVFARGWIGFAVNAATGEVSFGSGRR
jgi:hypothetical protein